MMMCWDSVAVLLGGWEGFVPPCGGERPEPVVQAIKERFTTSEQNRSVLTPSVPHTPAPALSPQPGAPTAMDFSRGSFQIQSGRITQIS